MEDKPKDILRSQKSKKRCVPGKIDGEEILPASPIYIKEFREKMKEIFEEEAKDG